MRKLIFLLFFSLITSFTFGQFSITTSSPSDGGGAINIPCLKAVNGQLTLPLYIYSCQELDDSHVTVFGKDDQSELIELGSAEASFYGSSFNSDEIDCSPGQVYIYKFEVVLDLTDYCGDSQSFELDIFFEYREGRRISDGNSSDARDDKLDGNETIKVCCIDKDIPSDGNGRSVISNSIQISPNPFNTQMYLTDLLVGDQIVVTDLLGRMVFQETMTSNLQGNKHEINLSDVSNGLFVVSIIRNKENIYTKKVTKH